MLNRNRPEIAFLIQNILPRFTDYLYPRPEDETNTKICEIPIRIGSGTQKPDVVYYWQEIPVFLIEAKKPGKSLEQAIKQALSYIRNFPVEEYSKDNMHPRYFAITIGKQIIFYRHCYEIKRENFIDWYEKLDAPILFADLLKEYGFVKIEKKEILSPLTFHKEVLNELGPIFKFEDKITPDVVENVAYQILAFLQYGRNFTGHRPYTDIERFKDRQAQIRQIYERFDWINSISPEIAKVFRWYIIRSFQGQLNQYLTEPCVIAFMTDLIGKLTPHTKVMDFECGSGGYLSAVIDKGVSLENIRGVDIAELPYIIAKTYLALYFKKSGKEIDTLPIRWCNGLFNHSENWDLIIGNPAGGNNYENGDEDRIIEEGLINLTGREHQFSEYELSIQQSIRSAKVNGKICIILPEGFFSNAKDEFLRKFIAKHCKILAIVSLPRGAFKKGTSVRQQQRGSQTSPQKMSILYVQKIREIDKDNPIGDIDFDSLNYPVFLASVSEPESKQGPIEDWLDPCLKSIYDEWQEWQTNHQLKELAPIIIKIQDKKAKRAAIPLFDEKTKVLPELKQKPTSPKSKTKISKNLEDLF